MKNCLQTSWEFIREKTGLQGRRQDYHVFYVSLYFYRELPELGKHCVMRVLFIDKPVGKPAVESWVKKSHQE